MYKARGDKRIHVNVIKVRKKLTVASCTRRKYIIIIIIIIIIIKSL